MGNPLGTGFRWRGLRRWGVRTAWLGCVLAASSVLAQDVDPPYLEEVRPPDGSSDVTVSTGVQVRFSEQIEPTSIDVYTEWNWCGELPPPGDCRVFDLGTMLPWIPADLLDGGEQLVATGPTQVTLDQVDGAYSSGDLALDAITEAQRLEPDDLSSLSEADLEQLRALGYVK